MSTKTVGYIRVSTSDQADRGVSLEVQRQRLAAYAVALDLDLVGILEDGGESAKNLDRPGIKQALAMLDSGEAEALLVFKLDRLTRSVRDLDFLIKNYFESRCQLLSVGDSIDTRTASGRLTLNLLASIAQWEREKTVELVTEAMAHKKSKGEYCGGRRPIGQRPVNGVLVPDEAEQAILATIKSLRAEGLTLRTISAQLAQQGHVNRQGRPFDSKTLSRLVPRQRAKYSRKVAA